MKHKKKLCSLALLGLLAGLNPAAGAADDTHEQVLDKAEGNMGYHLMDEEELLLQLNSEGRDLYMSLTPEGKKLALLVASQRCNLTNECKGLNACKTDSNECAGKGECRGKGKCSLANKNLAVKLVADKMAKKRNSL